MSAWPRWIELEIASLEHGEAAAPPHAAPPKETTMNGDRKCSTCSGAIGAGNKSGICTPCQRKPGGRPAPTRTHSDDAVLERIEVSSMKPPPPPKKVKDAPPPPGPVEEFFTLAQALGLEPQEMLDGWCRNWVEKTRARALASTTDVDELANAIKLVERAAATPKTEAAEP